MRTHAAKHSISHRGGFTLLELLTSMAILGVMLVMLFEAFDQASRSWLQAENRVETYTQARAALDFMTRELSQAVVNSNLQFLATSTNLAFIAPVNTGTNAVDLMEVVYVLSNTGPTTCSLVRRASAYGSAAANCWNYGTKSSCAGSSPWDFYSNPDWPETGDPYRTTVLADNISSLQFVFYDTNGVSASPSYWNSSANASGTSWSHENPNLPSGTFISTMIMTNRPPGGVLITIEAIDRRTAARLQAIAPNGTNAANITAVTNTLYQVVQPFTTFVEIPNK
jgi:prepilin-type N-terminal cleavage/methylation domain-containing protein